MVYNFPRIYMETIDIVIETPKHCSQKFAYDKKTGCFRLHKILPEGMVFPFDFGFIPHTTGEDGDPLDALVISEFKTFPGCLIECRLIGAELAEQKEDGKTIRNDRYFFIPILSRQFKKIEEINDLPKQFRKETEDFFIQYNKAMGKEFNILKIIEAKKAFQAIKK